MAETSTTVRASTAAPWLKTSLHLTEGALVGTTPTSFLLIPTGKRLVNQPFDRIANVTVQTETQVIRIMVGLALILLGILQISDAGVVWLILGVLVAAHALYVQLEVRDASGGIQVIRASVFDRDALQKLADEVSQRVNESSRQQSSTDQTGSTSPAAPVPGDRYDQLERIKRLRDEGVLSDSEFEAEKRKLLEG